MGDGSSQSSSRSHNDLLVNFERMRREMDELFDGVWTASRGGSSQRRSGFAPRVDVYYRDGGEAASSPAAGPVAIVKVDISGVEIENVSLEVSGRRLVISGHREIGKVSGRVYQQVEIPTGPFRRVIELQADVASELANAGYEDGILRIELPLKNTAKSAIQVPIERAE